MTADRFMGLFTSTCWTYFAIWTCSQDGDAAAEDALPPPFMAVGLDPLSYVYKI